MNNKQVMQQALKALNDSVYLVSEYYNEAVDLYYNQPAQQINLAALNTDVAAQKAAIEALESAIAQPVEPEVQYERGYAAALYDAGESDDGVQLMFDYNEAITKARAAIKAAS